MGQTGEIEQPWYDDGKPCTHQDVYHQVAHRFAQYDAEHAMIIALGRYQILETVVLACSTCRQTDTQNQCLLNNQDKDSRQHKRAIASCRTEDSLLVSLQGFRLYLFLSLGILACQLNLYLTVHLLRYRECSLISCLVCQHQTHVTIDADSGLLHAVDACLEVFWDIVECPCHIASYQHLSLIHVVYIGYYLDIGRRITHSDKLATQLRVTIVDHYYRNLTHHLIIIYP